MPVSEDACLAEVVVYCIRNGEFFRPLFQLIWGWRILRRGSKTCLRLKPRRQLQIPWSSLGQIDTGASPNSGGISMKMRMRPKNRGFSTLH